MMNRADLPFQSIVVCSKCGTANAGTDTSCVKCKANLNDLKRTIAESIPVPSESQPKSGVRCPVCLTENPTEFYSCKHCGFRIGRLDQTTLKTAVERSESDNTTVAEVIKCPQCNQENPADASYCSSCSHPFICRSCGSRYEYGESFCSRCEHPRASQPSKDSRSIRTNTQNKSYVGKSHKKGTDSSSIYNGWRGTVLFLTICGIAGTVFVLLIGGFQDPAAMGPSYVAFMAGFVIILGMFVLGVIVLLWEGASRGARALSKIGSSSDRDSRLLGYIHYTRPRMTENIRKMQVRHLGGSHTPPKKGRAI